MPRQEVFLDEQTSQGRVEVVKTYDESLARAAFLELDRSALMHLKDSLKLSDLYEVSDIPAADSLEFPDFLWDTVSEESREDGNVKSFFIVYQHSNAETSQARYVSPDWPSSDSFVARYFR